MYKKRFLKDTFLNAIKLFPALLLTGGRQTGKSTFLKEELVGYEYVSFDDPLERDFARNDPEGFLDRFKADPVILDEIQYVPALLQYIKIRIDRNRIPGRWILTGSQQFHLMKDLSESLAGRVAIFDLAQFSCGELASHEELVLEDILWNGLFPEVALMPEKREVWLRSYLQTYLERDIRQLENIKDFDSFETLVNLTAACHSQELNVSRLARDSGISSITAKNWLRLIEAGYFIYILKPFYKNFRKRIVKSAKLYFSDPALAAYLTRQPDRKSMLAGSMGGAFFEGFVVMEAVKCFYNNGRKPDIFFWRSHDGLELDLIIQLGSRIIPVEIKLNATPKMNFLEPVEQFKRFAEDTEIPCGVLVCRAEKNISMPNGNICLPWQNFYPWLDEQIKALRN